MTTIYQKANAECYQICSEIMEKYHGELCDFEVTIDLLFASIRPDDVKPGVVTLKLHGYPVAAYCKINPYKLRVQGHSDAEIVIDSDRWADMSIDEKHALMDHELQHLELKKNKEGEVLSDDLGRPKLSIAHHDHQYGWFDCIARRHGANSGEVQQFVQFQEIQPVIWAQESETEKE